MKRVITINILCIISILFFGCATIVTKKADLAKKPKGIRIYPPSVYLFVDEAEKKSTLAYAPDYKRAYDIKPVTIFANQQFNVEIEEGQLKKLALNQDTTAILTFLQGAAELGAKAAGVGVSSKTINGTFGLKSGVYRMDDNGVFHNIHNRK